MKLNADALITPQTSAKTLRHLNILGGLYQCSYSGCLVVFEICKLLLEGNMMKGTQGISPVIHNL
jgi:hypothetical protein